MFLAATLASAITSSSNAQSAAIEIPFAATRDPALKDPDNPAKTFRIDLAAVEAEFPLSRMDLAKITPENITFLSQEQLDQIYGRLTAGPIPDGQYLGNLLFARGDSLRVRLEEILGGIQGRLAGAKIELIENLGRRLWKGKVFDRQNGVLRNMIDDLAVLRPLIDDVSTVPRSAVPREGLIGQVFSSDNVWLLFPAKVHCGQSLLDSRRESVIVDYAYNDEIEGYRASPDSLAGRGGLRIRDEIRMIRPGFYLGRAYANRMFLLNFTLFNPDVAQREASTFAAGDAVSEACWPGEQARKASLR
jgi:hypothetical protein